jgi:hypothetical protein
MCKTRSLLWAFVVIVLMVSCAPGEESDLDGDQGIAEAPSDAPEVAEPAATETSKPTATLAPAATDTAIPATAPTVVASETASETPTSEPTFTPEPADQCLACHTDMEKLMDTAAPEEKAPSESSGVG